MQKSSTAVLSTVFLVVMLVAAVLWGAHKGWHNERAQVEQSVAGLEEMLAARKEVAHNVLTVAERHLPSDDTLLKDLKKLTGDMGRKNTLAQSAALNAQVEQTCKQLLNALNGMESVRADDRDLMYVSGLLPQALEQTARLTEHAVYNQLAEDFNHRKQNSISGRLAGLLGVRDAELFVAKEGTP